MTKTSFHNLSLDRSRTTGTRHKTSSMLKLLQSPLSQSPDIMLMLMTSSLRHELSRSRMGSNRCASLNAAYVTVYFTPEQARASRHPLQLIPKVSFSPHPPSHQYQAKSASAIRRMTAFHLASISASRRYRPFNGACPSSPFSRPEKIHDRLLED